MSKRIICLFCFAVSVPVFIFAQYFNTPPLLFPYTANPPEIGSRAAVLIDAATGTLLFSKNPDEEIPPASLTKLMTMHLIMNEIDAGRASYDEIIPITVESWAQSQPPGSSLMFLAPGQIVTLREIMLGLAVSSGNDAAVAAALRLAPAMDDFAYIMTMEARRMGLYVTRFVESSGISEYNITTAAEYAWFCRQYIMLHPDSLKEFHSVPVFSYPTAANVPEIYRNNPRTITQENRNNLLKTFEGVDGLKTGYIDESGYNIALTAKRDDTRFIAVILGAPVEAAGIRIRDADGERLLSWAFENFKTVCPAIAQIENARLWKGRVGTVELKLSEPADFTSPFYRADTLVFETVVPKPLIAPLSAGAAVGYLVISDGYGELNRVPLVTAQSYEKGNIFIRIWHSIVLLFNDIFGRK
ncbi:MAG: D-alanyl-D-alanine carboxypeptidase [Treponema sp.]|jgi:D-alanyl-D-alanine carboxypeptidase (penicillin-binding protein 5/6)|nr:D-alanyl-D-alanine carboxypeptidase [Treponema sp.]